MHGNNVEYVIKITVIVLTAIHGDLSITQDKMCARKHLNAKAIHA